MLVRWTKSRAFTAGALSNVIEMPRACSEISATEGFASQFLRILWEVTPWAAGKDQ